MPDKFAGDRSRLRDFLTQVQLVVQLNPARFPSDFAKVGFVGSLLSGTALSWFTPLVESASPLLNDFNAFVRRLQETFGDTNRARLATFRIRDLNQGSDTVATYIAKFRSVACDLDWGDSALLAHFVHGLNAEVRRLMLSAAEPTTLDEAVQLAARCDTRLFEFHRGSGATFGAGPGHQPYFGGEHFQAAAHHHHGFASHGEPMQVDAARKGPLSAKEKQRRRDNKLCLYCGQPGHFARECPAKGPQHFRVAAGAVAGNKDAGSGDKEQQQCECMKSRACSRPPSLRAQPAVKAKRCATAERAADKLVAAGALDPVPSFEYPVSIASASGGTPSINTLALIDSGATACFVDREFAARHKLPLRRKSRPVAVEAIDGRPLASGKVTHETQPLRLEIAGHAEDLQLNVISSPHAPVILGLSWLELHNPDIDWERRTVKFPTRGGGETVVVAAASAPPTPPPSVPAKYAEFADVFSKVQADKLPEHRQYDCPIDLLPDTTPPTGPTYPMSEPESKALREYIDENLAKGFIRHSKSSAGAPVLFVKKKDGSLRLCVDYRGLNRITAKNKYPLPLISALLDRLRTAKVFTKIDLRGAYNLVRMRKGDEWKTAFRTRFGLFEYLVMPFGLTNAPAVFQHMMNDVFREWLDVFVVVYLDDILVFSASQAEHDAHVVRVLERLREHGLYAKPEKCEFDRDTVEWLGFVISPTGVSMDAAKVRTVLDWATPTSVKDVQRFLGFANFYRRFIKDYSTVAAPLTDLTSSKVKFAWTPQAQAAFDSLKAAFASPTLLLHADPTKPFTVEADASDFAIGAVLSQLDSAGVERPVAFFSRKLAAAEINYEIYDKELLAIVAAFEQWRHYLAGAQHKVAVLSDHKNLKYFSTSRTLNRRQARWSIFLADFDFEIVYRPGADQGKADALSRRSEHEPTPTDEAKVQQTRSLLRPDHFRVASGQLVRSSASPSRALRDDIVAATEGDDFAKSVRRQLDKPARTADEDKECQGFKSQGGLLSKDGRLYVPPECRSEVLATCHDALLAGHFGVGKTLELVSRGYWWPHLASAVKEYVKSCDACARAKSSRRRPFGLLQPLPVPHRPWGSLSTDFITDLPDVRGVNAVLVVVCRLTKMAHFIACTKSETASSTAALMLNHVVKLHGLPDDIVSDRGPQFASRFWRRLFELLGTKSKLSTAFHPQTNGQAERTNQVLEQYLRCFINAKQSNWVSLLPMAEFAYNNTVQASTGHSPFYAVYGHHPRFDVNMPATAVNPAAEKRARDLEQIHADLKAELRASQESAAKYANARRSPAPAIAVGDMVWLRRKNIKSTKPCPKLDAKKIGPFKVVRQVSSVAYELQLPPTSKLHNVFHVSLLEPCYSSAAFPRVQAPVADDEALEGDGEGDYFEVEAIVDSKRVRRQLQYLVLWRNYPRSEATWEPAANLENAQEAVDKFHDEHPAKPQPNKTERRRLREGKC
jgi:transposase InsO family protein